MGKFLQAMVIGAMGLAAAGVGGGCAASREPVTVIEPTYSIVRGGLPLRDASQTRHPTPAPPLDVRIADSDPAY